MLVLPIKKKWFNMIKSGEKKEEYREIKPYWYKRFENDYKAIKYIDRHWLLDFKDTMIYGGYKTIVVLKNGYGRNAPKLTCICRITTGNGREEWGAEPNKEYFILKILEVSNVK